MQFNRQPVSYPGLNQAGDYTVTLARRDSPASSPIYTLPYLLHDHECRPFRPVEPKRSAIERNPHANARRVPSNIGQLDAVLQSIRFRFGVSVHVHACGPTCRERSGRSQRLGRHNRQWRFLFRRPNQWELPRFRETLLQNGGQINFPQTISPFSSGATNAYKFDGTTRLIFQSDGTVIVHNNSLAGSPVTMNLPANGIIAVNGDAVVEGTVHGRCTVTATGSALINGGIQYSDHTPSSTDTLAVVAQLDVIEPEYYYTGVTGPTLQGFAAAWSCHWEADGMIGGTWGSQIRISNPTGNQLPGDFHIDGTLVSLTGSSPTVIDPGGRPPGNFYVYGNSICEYRIGNGIHERRFDCRRTQRNV